MSATNAELPSCFVKDLYATTNRSVVDHTRDSRLEAACRPGAQDAALDYSNLFYALTSQDVVSASTNLVRLTEIAGVDALQVD